MLRKSTWRFWNSGTIPKSPVHWGREHYIPIKPLELVQKLVRLEATKENAPGFDASAFQTFATRVIDLVHHQYRSHQQRLIQLFDEFDPDVDLLPIDRMIRSDALAKQQRDIHCRMLFSEIADTLHHANYRRLKPHEIQEALKAASEWGVRLRIRFSSFRRLEVYGRGDIVSKRTKRDWYRGFRLREVDVPIYQRLIVAFRTKEVQRLPELMNPDRVHIRMFKNIPKADVDMMLPGTQIRLTWMDTGKIGLPTIWGMVMLVSKLAKSFWIIALFSAVNALSSFLLVISIALASLFYGIKSMFSYSTAKRRYQLNIAENLYYQNLDNNLGALLRIIDESEQQEACESILAYYVLIRSPKPIMTATEIDTAAEALLRELTGTDVDFDVNDAIRDLACVGILQPHSEGWTATPLIGLLNQWPLPRH